MTHLCTLLWFRSNNRCFCFDFGPVNNLVSLRNVFVFNFQSLYEPELDFFCSVFEYFDYSIRWSSLNKINIQKSYDNIRTNTKLPKNNERKSQVNSILLKTDQIWHLSDISHCVLSPRQVVVWRFKQIVVLSTLMLIIYSLCPQTQRFDSIHLNVTTFRSNVLFLKFYIKYFSALCQILQLFLKFLIFYFWSLYVFLICY